MLYIYLESEENFENDRPFKGSLTSTCKETFINECIMPPLSYPCVIEFEDYSSAENGYSFHIEIVKDMSQFLYQDGSLYKIDDKDFIFKDGKIFRKC